MTVKKPERINHLYKRKLRLDHSDVDDLGGAASFVLRQLFTEANAVRVDLRTEPDTNMYVAARVVGSSSMGGHLRIGTRQLLPAAATGRKVVQKAVRNASSTIALPRSSEFEVDEETETQSYMNANAPQKIPEAPSVVRDEGANKVAINEEVPRLSAELKIATAADAKSRAQVAFFPQDLRSIFFINSSWAGLAPLHDQVGLASLSFGWRFRSLHSSLRCGAIADVLSSQSKLWLVGPLYSQRLRFGVQLTGNLRYPREGNVDLAVVYEQPKPAYNGYEIALRSRNALETLTLSYCHRIVRRREVLNPFESPRVRGIYNYVDLGVEVAQTRGQAPQLSIGTAWQVNSANLLKAKFDNNGVALVYALRMATIPSVLASWTCHWDSKDAAKSLFMPRIGFRLTIE
eukprot:GILJ01008570.1.p1 GENE.GILJ01008570.1~~GILJ01008570.1.p1  ORF type:complete len:417 (-),score=39.09 GILJ01008570.1:49-1257(-)